MKKLITFLTIGSMVLLTSCGGTKESATVSQADRENVNTSTRKSTSVRNARETTTEKRTTSAMNRNNDTYFSDNLKAMYSALDMTSDQIKRFESQWRRSVDSWKVDNQNQEMNRYERVERQDRILKDILDESQFENYQQWARDHASHR